MPRGALVLRTNSEERGMGASVVGARLASGGRGLRPRPLGSNRGPPVRTRPFGPWFAAERHLRRRPGARLPRTLKRTPPPTPSRQSPTSGRASLLRLRRHGQEAYASSAQSRIPAIGRIRARAGPRGQDRAPGPPAREVTHSALVDQGWSALHVSREPGAAGREGPEGPWRNPLRRVSASVEGDCFVASLLAMTGRCRYSRSSVTRPDRGSSFRDRMPTAGGLASRR